MAISDPKGRHPKLTYFSDFWWMVINDEANKRGCSTADVIEKALEKYFKDCSCTGSGCGKGKP